MGSLDDSTTKKRASNLQHYRGRGSIYASIMQSGIVDGLEIHYLACGLWHIWHRVLAWVLPCWRDSLAIRHGWSHHDIVRHSYVGFRSNVDPSSSMLAHYMYAYLKVSYLECALMGL